jgi:hypothetical protein
MPARKRLLWFGGSGLLVVLGVIAQALIGGVTGEAVMIALVSLGAIAIVSLVFLEVGLSEDRERAGRRASETAQQERPRRPPARRRR